MNKRKLLLAIVGMSALLGGCGLMEDVDTTTISVKKDGAVTETIVEAFDKEYYNADELSGGIEGQLQSYNSSAGEDGVKLESVETTEDGRVKVKITYSEAGHYTALNGRELFAGTVSDAYGAGYEFVGMQSPDGQTIDASKVLELGDKKMVISEELLNIKVSGKIIYASEGVTVVGNDTAVLPDDGENLSYVIYE